MLTPPSTPFPYTTLFRSAPVAFHCLFSTRASTCTVSTIQRPCCRSSTRSSAPPDALRIRRGSFDGARSIRSEEHTSELQQPCNLVCRLRLEQTTHSR